MSILDRLFGTKKASPTAQSVILAEQSKPESATKTVQPFQPSTPAVERPEPRADGKLKVFHEGSSFYLSGTNIEEGVFFNLLFGQFCLVFCYSNFSPNELNDLRGPGQFGAYVEDGMLFFLYKFGAAWSWGDMTFNWWLVNEAERQLPANFTTADRIPLTLCVVDSRKNEILTLRRITIPPLVTRVIVDAILAQTKTAPISSKNDPAYVALQKKIRDRYTSEQIATLAVIGEAGTT